MVGWGVPAPVIHDRVGHTDGLMLQNYIGQVAERHALEETVFYGPPEQAAAPVESEASAPSALHPLTDHDHACPKP